MSNAIEISGLTKVYGAVRAVDGLDLTVPAGQVMALLGPNGAGKSTTTEMLLGLVTPDSGTVRVLGVDPLAAVRDGHIGAMLQSGAMWEGLSVKAMLNAMRGMYAHPLTVDDVVARADLGAFLGTKVEKLSGGQRQRVRFALALLGDPDVILLDEPTVGLDVEARRHFWAAMHDVAAEGKTVVFATHYLDEADEFADRIVVMAAGRVVADGTGEEIRAVVAGRRITFTADADEPWEDLPGVTDVTRTDHRVELACRDSDAAIRALVAHPVRDIEITTPSLEDAFLRITEKA